MPYIEAKVTVPVGPEKKEILKSKFGKAVSLIRKPESYLMVGIEDSRDLWFAGKKLEKGAYVSVSAFGDPSRPDCAKMAAELTKILGDELQIPGEHIYITFHPVQTWAWQGGLF